MLQWPLSRLHSPCTTSPRVVKILHVCVPPPFPPPQVRMYQLMALLHEYLPTLHAHLEKHTVSAYLIAASWFLTMFSSQYPFAFVSRVMGEWVGVYIRGCVLCM